MIISKSRGVLVIRGLLTKKGYGNFRIFCWLTHPHLLCGDIVGFKAHKIGLEQGHKMIRLSTCALCLISHKSNFFFIFFYCTNTLRGDKVSISMSTHTYAHKTLRKIKVAICNRQTACPFYLWPMSDLVICKYQEYESYRTPKYPY